MATGRLEGQLLDSLLDRGGLVLPTLARVQEQDVLGADDGLVALLAALAVFPRLGLEAANHAHAAALVKEARALLGQLVPGLNRRPLRLNDALAGLVPPRQPVGRNSKVADCLKKPTHQEALRFAFRFLAIYPLHVDKQNFAAVNHSQHR
jgi:hypothetical protein